MTKLTEKQKQRMIILMFEKFKIMHQYCKRHYLGEKNGRTYEDVRQASHSVDICLNNLCSDGFQGAERLYSIHDQLREKCYSIFQIQSELNLEGAVA